jgi:hypothetical protein
VVNPPPPDLSSPIFASTGEDPLLLDLDDENKTLSRFFPEAIKVEIKKSSSHDILVEKALSSNHSLVLADLKAGTGRYVLNWFSDVPFDELHSLGVRFVCIGSITSSPDSAQSFLNWVTVLQNRVSTSSSKTSRTVTSFPITKPLPKPSRFARTSYPATSRCPVWMRSTRPNSNGSTLRSAKCWTQTMAFLRETRRLAQSCPKLLVRARLRSFQRRIYEQLSEALQLLLPTFRREAFSL